MTAGYTPLGAYVEVAADNFSQRDPIIETLSDGKFVVAWESDGQDGDEKGIFARVFNADGSPLTDAFQVNTRWINEQTRPAILADDAGGFRIVYHSEWDEDFDGAGLYAQGYDNLGQADGDETFLGISQYVSSLLSSDLPGGGHIMVYSVPYYDQSANDIGVNLYMRRLNDDLQSIGNAIQVNTSAPGDGLMAADIATLNNGNVLIVWSDDGIHGTGTGIFGQIMTPAGAKIGGEFVVNTIIEGRQLEPKIAVLEGGNVVVTYKSGYNQDGSDWGVFAQMFEQDGTPLGDEFVVNSTTQGYQYYGDPIAMPDGGFLVVFETSGDPGGIFAQRYTSDGTKIGSEGQIAVEGSSSQHFGNPAIAVLEDGSFAVTWMGWDSSLSNIYANVFEAWTFGTTGQDDLTGDVFANNIGALGGHDEISGMGGDDELNGGEGNDTVNGDGGDDTLEGEAGDDLLNGGNQNDTLNGGNGADTLLGSFGNDLLNGEGQADTLDGGSGVDTLIGGGGDDYLYGGASQDELYGSGGSDTLDGGEGSDLHVVDAGDIVADTGTSGYDKAKINDASGVSLDLTGWSGVERINGFTGDDTLDGSSQTESLVLIGGDGADSLIGGSSADILIGGNGQDTLVGGEGADKLIGGEDTDTFRGGGGNDKIFISIFLENIDGGEGYDKVLIADAGGMSVTVSRWDSIERVNGYTGADAINAFDVGHGMGINGGAGDDTLTGSDFVDNISGGADADIIKGRAGNDMLTGGSGADVFVFDNVFGGGFDDDTVTDFTDGEDLLDYSGIGGVSRMQDLRINQDGNDVVISEKGAGGNGTVTLLNTLAGEIDASDFIF